LLAGFSIIHGWFAALDGHVLTLKLAAAEDRGKYVNALFKKIVRFADILSGIGGLLAGILMCAGVAMIAFEIILRGMFNQTLYVTEEYAGYLMAMLTFCALGYTLRERGHIRMTFLHRVVVGRRRLYLDIACYVIGFGFCTLLTYFTGLFFWDSVVTGSRSMQVSQTYLAVPQAFLPIGALIFALQFIGEIFRSILILRADTAGLTLREDGGKPGR
jgi:TRAP-type C4-dicarboxylate transport system permease small subunit